MLSYVHSVEGVVTSTTWTLDCTDGDLVPTRLITKALSPGGEVSDTFTFILSYANMSAMTYLL